MFQLDISIAEIVLSVLGTAGLKRFVNGEHVITKKAGVMSGTVLELP